VEQTTTATTEKATNDQLAQLESDKSVLFFGIVPLVIIVVAGVACGILYFARRKKNWNELGDAMRIDDGDKPIPEGAPFDSAEAGDLDPTKPSQRLSRTVKPE
jgi:hypothetical protein